MKKKLGIISLFTSLIASPLLCVVGQEPVNISPIESVEFIGGEAESSQDTSDIPVATPEITNSTNTQTEEDPQNSSINPNQASDLITSLSDQTAKTSGDYVVLKQADGLEIYSYSYTKDNNIYHIRRHNYGNVPFSFYAQVDDTGQVQKLYLAINDLYSYSDDAMTRYPELYQATIVEEIYNLSQTRSDLADSYLELSLDQAELVGLASEVIDYQKFTLTSLNTWIENDQVIQAGVGDQNKVDIELDEETAPIFKETIDQKSPDYPTLAYIYDLFPVGYLGEVTFDYSLGEIGLALLSDIDQSTTNALEGYVRLSQTQIPNPDELNFINENELNDLFGEGFLTQIIELENTLSINDFQTEPTQGEGEVSE